MCTHRSSLQHSHDTRHVEISLCRTFLPTRFLNTIFRLQKLVSKMYRAKVSTADSLCFTWRQNYFSCCCAEELVSILKRNRNKHKFESFNESLEQVTCSSFTLIFWLDSYSIKMHIKIQFYNPTVQRTTQLKFGLIINHVR